MKMKEPIALMTRKDLLKVKEIIDSTALFPSEYLDEMTENYFGTNSNDEIWFTYGKEEPIGILYCAPERMTDGTRNALLLAVHKKHQGKGIGSKLMNHLEQFLIEQDVRMLLVETSGLEQFAQTRQFYLNNGYEKIATIPEYYEAGDAKIIFQKRFN